MSRLSDSWFSGCVRMSVVGSDFLYFFMLKKISSKISNQMALGAN